MGVLEIVLIVIGVLVVIGSFVFGDKLWGKEENPDIEAHKEQLKKQMDEVFETHAAQAKDRLEASTRESLEQYVEDVKHSLEVMINEAKAYIDERVEQSNARMREYISQAQEDSIVVSADTKEKMEEMLAEHQRALKASSEQVIAEINNHHNDVTFLYSMINDKEEEIKQHAQMVEELQSTTRQMEQEIKSAQTQVMTISETTKTARKEFVSEIAEGVMQEITSGNFTAEAASETAAAKEEMEGTKVFSSGDVTGDSSLESAPTKATTPEEIAELLHAIGQTPEKVAQEDGLFIQKAEADITDALFEEPASGIQIDEIEINEDALEDIGGIEIEIEEAAAAILEATAAEEEEPKQTETVSEEESREAESNMEEAEDFVLETETEDAGEAAEEAEAVSEETSEEKDTGEAAKDADTVQADDSDAQEAEEESDAVVEAESEKVEETTPETTVELKQDAVGNMAEDVVEKLMAQIPTKLIQAVEKSRTVSNEADMEMRVKVLELYDKGYSSMEIAEQMKLGIGEVRMIVDLYSRRER